MMNKYLVFLAILAILGACQAPGGNQTGSEYMPDMGHSVAIEANLYTNYSLNTWDDQSTIKLKKASMPGQRLTGTIPRGYTGDASIERVLVPTNGYVPYNYGDTQEERMRAASELLNNPFPITDNSLKSSKELYEIYCGICHGKKGDGNGYLVRDDGGVYPSQPVSFVDGEFLTASNGRYYHAIMHGKNVMGSYRDKLSYKERWEVIHYIRSMQAKKLGKEYNESVNTLDGHATPGALSKIEDKVTESMKVEDHATEVMDHDTDHSAH